TYIFRYEHWVQGGLIKVLNHLGIAGSMAALTCAVLVPASFLLSEQIGTIFRNPFRLKLHFVPSSVLAVTIVLWIFGIAVYVF
ncbi:hypothetical protein ACFL5Z_12400, partial [Planctomycetota bacterium]